MFTASHRSFARTLQAKRTSAVSAQCQLEPRKTLKCEPCQEEYGDFDFAFEASHGPAGFMGRRLCKERALQCESQSGTFSAWRRGQGGHWRRSGGETKRLCARHRWPGLQSLYDELCVSSQLERIMSTTYERVDEGEDGKIDEGRAERGDAGRYEAKADHVAYPVLHEGDAMI